MSPKMAQPSTINGTAVKPSVIHNALAIYESTSRHVHRRLSRASLSMAILSGRSWIILSGPRAIISALASSISIIQHNAVSLKKAVTGMPHSCVHLGAMTCNGWMYPYHRHEGKDAEQTGEGETIVGMTFRNPP